MGKITGELVNDVVHNLGRTALLKTKRKYYH